MDDERSYTERGEVERAMRLRRIIENLKDGHADDSSSPEGKSLKEQIEERARAGDQNKGTPDSE